VHAGITVVAVLASKIAVTVVVILIMID